MTVSRCEGLGSRPSATKKKKYTVKMLVRDWTLSTKQTDGLAGGLAGASRVDQLLLSVGKGDLFIFLLKLRVPGGRLPAHGYGQLLASPCFLTAKLIWPMNSSAGIGKNEAGKAKHKPRPEPSRLQTQRLLLYIFNVFANALEWLRLLKPQE